MIASLFVLGGFWFWCLIIVECAYLIYKVDDDEGGQATVSVIVTLLLLQFLGDIPVFQWIWHNPLLLLAGVACYLLSGVGWATFKWWFFVTNRLYEYKEKRSEFLREHKVGGNEVPANLQALWVEYIKDRPFHVVTFEDVVPQVADNKSRILTWMSFWPWSAFWTILNDPIKRAFRRIFNNLRAYYQRMSDRVFAEIQKDFSASVKTTNKEG